MNSMLEYKGYHADIKFDADDEIFIGEVFGIADSLNFHGQSVSEIKEMFHQSIDKYLQLCKEIGKDPEKEFKGTFNVRISSENHKRAALAARKKNITLNQFVSNAIEHELNKENDLSTNWKLILKKSDLSINIQDNDLIEFEDYFIFDEEQEFKMGVVN